MKKACIWQFIISFFLSNLMFCQLDNDSVSLKKNKSELRLRLGIDLFQPIISQLDKDINGLELVGDFQIKENIYILTNTVFSILVNMLMVRKR